MCAEYQLRASVKDVQGALRPSVKNLTGQSGWDMRVKFTLRAPVIEMVQGDLQIVMAVFPAQPFPNARLSSVDSRDHESIVRVYEKPTWSEGFKSHRCLVPMTSFFEPVYWGDAAGTVQEFSDHASGLFFVPAIKIKPRVPPTGKTDGFSLLTHTASPQMLKYHHRLLVFLKPDDAVQWLVGDTVDVREKFDFLLSHRYTPELSVSQDRTMAKGWEKRASSHQDDLKEEEAYVATLKEVGER